MRFYIQKLLLGWLFLIAAVCNIFAQTADLSTYIKNSLAPAGTVIYWYTVPNPDPNNPSANSVGSYSPTSVTPVNVTATTTATDYYAFFYDPVNKCFSPGYKMSLVTNACPSTQVDLNPLSKSVAPAGAVLEWHSGSSPSGSTLVGVDDGSTAILVGDGVYFPVYHDSVNNCYSPVGAPIVVVTKLCYCYRLPRTDGSVLDTNHGITAMNRAGADNQNWPMVRKGAWTVLEANTKGFVVNRVAFDASGNPVGIPSGNFVKGMMVYDTVNNCLKIFNGTVWSCFTTPACPDGN